MSAAIYTTEAIYAGDTWPGIPSITIRVNDLPPANAVAGAKLVFYKADESPLTPALTLTDEAGDIEIIDASNWQLAIPGTPLDLPPGEWTFRFSTNAATSGNELVRTWIVGTLTIL